MTDSVSLSNACRQLAFAGNLDPEVLIKFATEDTVGGWHPDESQRQWPTGAMFAVEGQLVYALVRAMRPSLVCEVGTYDGCSATHILAALDKNRRGKLVSIDINCAAGRLIPDALKKRWSFLCGEGAALIPPEAEIVFEDADHYAGTKAVFEAVRASKARLILSHDAEHYLVGSAVRTRFQEVFGTCETVQIDPAHCGLAYKFLESA